MGGWGSHVSDDVNNKHFIVVSSNMPRTLYARRRQFLSTKLSCGDAAELQFRDAETSPNSEKAVTSHLRGLEGLRVSITTLGQSLETIAHHTPSCLHLPAGSLACSHRTILVRDCTPHRVLSPGFQLCSHDAPCTTSPHSRFQPLAACCQRRRSPTRYLFSFCLLSQAPDESLQKGGLRKDGRKGDNPR